MTSTPSVIGGACIIASVCVGAGMLGLPSAGAGAWTSWSTLAIILTMVVMTVSGWMLLEALKPYALTASFNSVTKDLLGHRINLFNNLTVYFVGGILLYAYITSSGLILGGLLGINSQLASVLFVLVFSWFVWHSTRAVDRISVVLIVFMVLSFVFGVSGLASKVDTAKLFNSFAEELGRAPYALAMLPVALTSFGYHHSVASMRAYYGEEQKARQAILGGTLIALALYLLWLLSIFGNLPRPAFGPVIAKGGDVDVLLGALASVIESRQVSQAINLFSMAAILSSFIGVGLGVFDYLADLFRFDNSRRGRAKSWAVTFLPPPGALPDVPVRLRGGHRLCRGRGDRLGLHHPGPAGEEVPGAGPGRGGVQGSRRPAHGGGRHRLRGAYRHLSPDGHGGSAARLHRLTLVR